MLIIYRFIYTYIHQKFYFKKGNFAQLFFVDINECNGYNECHQLCNNTDGSYTCSCQNGFTLNTTDNATCEGRGDTSIISAIINVPLLANVQCARSSTLECAVVNGINYYYCRKGYRLSGDQSQCIGKIVKKVR